MSAKTGGISAESYSQKRDFARTPEPVDNAAARHKDASAGGGIFVVHKHAASRLHWDLRLENNGALESWAVPKEPPVEPLVKRLAVRVEDHPLAYASFEGTIPEGNYGAGTVEIWDKGTYGATKRKAREILLDFKGKKLRGNYALINTGGKNWLFFKRKI